jgi:K+-sensing histidine kinase KdpD
MGELLRHVRGQASQLTTLQRTTRELERRVALRAQIEALLAHEMRAPITMIVGVLETLHAEPRKAPLGDDHAQELIGRALAQCRYLTEVVDDLLSADPEAGTTFTHAVVRPARLGDLLDRAFAAVSDAVPATRVHREIDSDLEVSTAPSRFIAIVVNLLENAAKYGGQHVVELSVGLQAENLVVEVGDRGPGLRGDSAERLFDAFVRGQGVDDVPGDGIGLYLVRMLAGSLGGTATIEERRGGGLLARVTLPQRRSGDVRQGEPAPHRALTQPGALG